MTERYGATVSSRDKSALGLIAIIWLGMVFLVNPMGDFPLNDDWAYGWSVKTLLEKGEFQLSDWTAVNLMSQVFWGALFCLPLGFSFTALRLSTLTLGFIGVIATYGTLREVKASPGVALAGALTVTLNPLYFCLSNSFMTDVPSFTFTTVAFYFLIRALTRHSVGSLVAGVTMTLVSILNRQIGVIVIPAFAVAYVMKDGFRRRSMLAALLIGLPGLALYLIYPRWLDVTGRTPYLYDLQTTKMLSSLSASVPDIVATYAQNLFVMSTYLGLFLLPFLLLARSELLLPRNIARPKTVAALLLVVAAGLWAAKYECMPSVGNILNVAGLGPSAISGPKGVDLDPLTLRRIWQVVTVAGVVGAALLLRGAVPSRSRGSSAAART